MAEALHADLDAVKAIVEAVSGLQVDERARVFRWAAEKLKLDSNTFASPRSAMDAPATGQPPRPTPPRSTDLRSFVTSKKPGNDVQFAAVVAYYNLFEAPARQRKGTITARDLAEACRQAQRERMPAAAATLALHNAVSSGLLDKADKGAFALNNVGEHLVAMALPANGADGKASERSRVKGSRAGKRSPAARKARA